MAPDEIKPKPKPPKPFIDEAEKDNLEVRSREPEMELTAPNIERPTAQHDDDEDTSTLRRLINNAERLFRR